MRFISLKSLSLGLALVSTLSLGAASAQSLVGVNARLDRALDTRGASAGQVVTARLAGTVVADGTKLPKGTELIGKIADVKNANGAVSVSLVFTSAKLKDGKEIPVKATVIAAYPELDPVATTLGDVAVQPAPAQVPADGVFQQQPGALAHVSLTSAVKDHDSATFSSTTGSFRLQAGTNLQFGIGSPSAASATSAAE